MLDLEPDEGRAGCLLALAFCAFFWAGVVVVVWGWL
jgi:hypothetical protein